MQSTSLQSFSNHHTGIYVYQTTLTNPHNAGLETGTKEEYRSFILFIPSIVLGIISIYQHTHTNCINPQITHKRSPPTCFSDKSPYRGDSNTKKRTTADVFFLFFYWRYNPLWVLAFSVTLFHSTLSLHNFLHPLIPIICISSSMSSIHLFLGLPLFLLPVGFHSSTLLSIIFPSIRIT